MNDHVWTCEVNRSFNILRLDDITRQRNTTLLDRQRLRAVGLSSYHPVASNRTVSGRSQNRRIEIGLLPEPAEAAE